MDDFHFLHFHQYHPGGFSTDRDWIDPSFSPPLWLAFAWVCSFWDRVRFGDTQSKSWLWIDWDHCLQYFLCWISISKFGLVLASVQVACWYWSGWGQAFLLFYPTGHCEGYNQPDNRFVPVRLLNDALDFKVTWIVERCSFCPKSCWKNNP